jgi:hypothetical protein
MKALLIQKNPKQLGYCTKKIEKKTSQTLMESGEGPKRK